MDGMYLSDILFYDGIIHAVLFPRFITGDVAQRLGCRGYYQIMGRNSIDIIKVKHFYFWCPLVVYSLRYNEQTGGEKVSALEIEREILSCRLGVQDVAVVGIPDPEWGQKVAAVVVLEDGKVMIIVCTASTLDIF